jgi:hypothetical protein
MNFLLNGKIKKKNHFNIRTKNKNNEDQIRNNNVL